ncbi:NAD-dependent epimerase/dehydratase family protein [Candidatus Micrarchaeota archaeon]|nr:NAD-dependent epimerase/dehydratase family protein [Candidatus Micrarchaeota archaeon]
MKVAVTGGAGFIGSHLADALTLDNEVLIIDHLSSGKKENINPKAKYIKKDIREETDLSGVETVFHLAADPNVRSSAETPEITFAMNVKGTFSVLESCRKNDVKHIVFASTSTVYGEAPPPTSEDYPCRPISNYGASKVAGEAFISSYCSTYGMKGTIMRFANIFGERSGHGIMFDFYHKLKKNPEHMEILGDGKQDKSYLHVSDAVSAVLLAWKKTKNYDVFNVGSTETANVDRIANLVAKNMGLSPSFAYTGTRQGWKGDVPAMLLDCSRLRSLGWNHEISFEKGVERYIKWLSANY